MDGFPCITLVEQQPKPHIDHLYGGVDIIWQDDGDSKHRSHNVLDEINEIFSDGVKSEEQADKTAADICSIEHISSYIKAKLRGKEMENVPKLKNKIVKIWRRTTPQICSK